jgi:hypothetical protein
MSTDYPAAQEHFVPRNFMFNSNACKVIVIHKTGGDATPQAVYNTFINSGNPGKSSHYAIGTDGSIWQFVPESLGAGANGITDSTTDPFWQPYMQQYGNLNTCTISIEHCDASSANDTPLTTAQKQASFALVAHLCQKYGIPASHIKPHRSVCATTCPGTYPMTELVNFIQQGGNMPPTNWKDDGKTLTAPNGHRVVLGFRDYVLSHNWDAHNQPMEEEWHADPLEVSNPSLGAGQKQGFTWTTLEYTAERGVFEAYQGQEIVALRTQIAAAHTSTPVDTTQVKADVEAIIDALPPLFAKLMLDISKLS